MNDKVYFTQEQAGNTQQTFITDNYFKGNGKYENLSEEQGMILGGKDRG